MLVFYTYACITVNLYKSVKINYLNIYIYQNIYYTRLINQKEGS